MDEVTKIYVFYLTILLIIIKCSLVVFLSKKVVDKKRNKIEAGVKFLTATAVLMAGLFVSRIIFTIFDFQLTDFDSTKYPEHVLLWKIAFLVATITLVYMIWILDKVVIENKLKGIPAIILIILAIFIFVYPVNTVVDFQILSAICAVANLVSILIPGVFIYVGKNSSGDIRKNAYFISLGMLVYALSMLLVNEALISAVNAAFGFDSSILFWIISMTGKCIGLTIFTHYATKFVSD